MTIPKSLVYRMLEACQLNRGLIARNPVKEDLSGEYEALQAWALVVPLYSGIEQALKMLLLTPADPRFALNNNEEGKLNLKGKRYGHNLRNLYAELEDEDREHVELHFREHWSFYDYRLPKGVVINSAEDFIVHINGGNPPKGLGWRYFLVEDTEVPSTNLWTMSEIWDALCCRIKAKVLDKPDGCFRLSRRLSCIFERLVTGRAVPYDGLLEEFNRWVALKNGDCLAAWIDLLVKASRDAMHEVQAPDRLRRDLADMARRAIDQLSKAAGPDEVQLLRGIQHTERTLVWDPGSAEFCWIWANSG